MTVSRDARVGRGYISRQGDTGSIIWRSCRDSQNIGTASSAVNLTTAPGQILFSLGTSVRCGGEALVDPNCSCSGAPGVTMSGGVGGSCATFFSGFKALVGFDNPTATTCRWIYGDTTFNIVYNTITELFSIEFYFDPACVINTLNISCVDGLLTGTVVLTLSASNVFAPSCVGQTITIAV